MCKSDNEFSKLSNHELRSNPVELARYVQNRHVLRCANPTRFYDFDWGVIVWVWEDERVRKIWGARRMWAQDWCGHLIAGILEVEIIWKIWIGAKSKILLAKWGKIA